MKRALTRDGRMSFAVALAAVLAIGAPLSGSAEDRGTVRPAYDGLLEGRFQTKVVNIGLERLGFKVDDIRHLEIPSMHVAVVYNDADFIAVHWQPLQNTYYEE
jgi:glycine betaine/proline transport system substrate-binding protein